MRARIMFLVRLLLMVGPFLLLSPQTGAGHQDRSGTVPKDPGDRRRNTDNGGIEFRMKNKKWIDVFGWLGSRTGVPVIGSATINIPGSFTFLGRRGAKYSIPEIVRLINKELRHEQMVLIRRPRSFTVMPAEAVNA